MPSHIHGFAAALAATLMIAAAPAIAAEAETTSAEAQFIGLSGEETGTATLTGTARGVLIQAEVRDLPAGQWVAFHIHEGGTCDAADHHKSAGGHFNPGNTAHGFLAEGGPHAGDMPNQMVGADGALHAEAFNPMVRLDDGPNGIRGRTLMIHSGRDDHRSQPSGNAGDRLACAVIE